jgi:acyl-CoA synthetase (AMP-forming)/AMP-acid ligase II
VNIAAILKERAARHPDLPAIIDTHRGRSRTTTFGQLEDAVAQGASLLLRHGLVAGDTVLIFQPMSTELYTVLMAVFRLGMTAMFLDPSAGKEHIQKCCAIRPPAAFIASPKAHLLRLIVPALRRIPSHFGFCRFLPGTTSWHRAARLAPHPGIQSCTAETPALITFTSGSTGMPKAAVRTHGFLREQHRVLEHTIHLAEGKLDMATLPIFVLANLASGMTSLIPDADLRHPGSIDPDPVLRQIRQFRPSSIAASPAFLEQLCEKSRTANQAIEGFHHVFTGGAPVFPGHLDRCGATFSGSAVVAVYGSTEAEPIAHVDRDLMTGEDMEQMRRGKGLLTGAPIAESTVRIMPNQWGKPLGPFDERAFDSLRLPTGEPGEIVVTGRHVLKGYLNGVGDGETKFRVGDDIWHRTGDCGYFDDRGYLWLLGRAAAVIEDEQGTLYPFAVECAAMQLANIGRAALVSRNGKRVLYVEPANPAGSVDTAALATALDWACLDEVRPVEKIPVDRRHNAKVDYTRLP